MCINSCNPMDSSPPGSSVHEILQARILEWVAISSSRGSSPPRDGTQVSCPAGKFFTIWATRETQNQFSYRYSRDFMFLLLLVSDAGHIFFFFFLQLHASIYMQGIIDIEFDLVQRRSSGDGLATRGESTPCRFIAGRKDIKRKKEKKKKQVSQDHESKIKTVSQWELSLENKRSIYESKSNLQVKGRFFFFFFSARMTMNLLKVLWDTG